MSKERDIDRAARIRELRIDHHLTQPVVADKVGVILRAYQQWEAGGGITWDNVQKLAKVLKTTPEYILNGPDVPTKLDPLAELRAQLDQLNTKLDLLLKQQTDPDA